MSMSKTGKKVKSVNCDSIDLTFNEIYDVFIDIDEYEFIIDDVGDKRYVRVDDKDYYELVDDVAEANNTESNYTKTGKKVKSIYDGRADLTYNEVYDVFIDNKGDEFIIDDVGDKRYWSISDDDYYELVDDVFPDIDEYEFIIDDVGNKRYVRVDDKNYYELVDDVASATNTTDDIHNTNETKLKFKVGDKVRVVDSNYISIFTNKVKLDDVGVINFVDNDYSFNPYRVKFDETDVRNEWWFTDKCIELVVDDSNTIENENTPIKSDGTKSYYTNTGKKFMCINSNRRALTYKKVYDVFTNQDSAEFIIDDVGDKRYESLEFPYWCEKSDGMVDKANETKPKFKVGDRVMVVNTDYISAYDAGVRVGDIGTVIGSGVDKYHVKFEGTGYDCDWWFTDKCIELVGDDNTTNKKYNPLVVQQSGNHYKNGEIQPIEYSERNNLSTCQGNIVKYITRHKEKNGVDDLAKIVHYALLEALFVYGEDGATELRDKVDSLINIGNKE